ncbi:apicoplast ribosomal protein S6, putative [Plasmodium knowlesi strain H]|uniref:Apicoplast ribosomal protein S6, putative n=3 Tax=Plasmodium knowlesi TaxID=5850 RepID=A0A5K1U8N9_PLAKH|nr:apicoplast ribosomal protein S6, putative [Plasmodium knowlesi strain H]OTN67338.1 putative 30s ribosomal protein s6-like protein [Plasmodium knowlesi]CAA9987604.1 apicoplast ribosomal protein S6, putative [Plasmodium knowlesi strain H]SBO26998.1 apicoplast ribosomal protein S6, putative [Plasmodium knowlesi strain H]SBO29241.1 apicoplast ribosomal protein S6, putative [Plasmodium knowlesi strain H]VVS77078.1 apicoplast ribosomal protein S6, putative [Plasmodium knowlesi strain H]|eukprot:XP_002258605.1 30s ribosomal protein s6-like protein, putative [Plasmodium knowlesi strain H]
MHPLSLLLVALITTLQYPLFARRLHAPSALGVSPVRNVVGVVGRGAFIRGCIDQISRASSYSNGYPINGHYRAFSTANKQRGHHMNFRLGGSLNDYIYKLLLRRFKKISHKGAINIFKSVLSPRRSYNIDLLFSCNYTISEIKKKIAEYMYELKLVDGENFKAVYLGKRRLVRPIKKQMEAYYVLFSFEMYPSLILEIKRKLSLQDAVLRFMVNKNEKTSKNLQYQENEPVRQGMAATEAQFFKKAE